MYFNAEYYTTVIGEHGFEHLKEGNEDTAGSTGFWKIVCVGDCNLDAVSNVGDSITGLQVPKENALTIYGDFSSVTRNEGDLLVYKKG